VEDQGHRVETFFTKQEADIAAAAVELIAASFLDVVTEVTSENWREVLVTLQAAPHYYNDEIWLDECPMTAPGNVNTVEPT